jgi:hypothetical protein
MAAQVLAIGAFQEDLAEHLAYPAGYYANTCSGVPVVHFLFELGLSLNRVGKLE